MAEKKTLNVSAIIVLVAVVLGFIATKASYLNIADCEDCGTGLLYNLDGTSVDASEGVEPLSSSGLLLITGTSDATNGAWFSFKYILQSSDSSYSRFKPDLDNNLVDKSVRIIITDPTAKQVYSVSKPLGLNTQGNYATDMLTFQLPSSPSGTYKITVYSLKAGSIAYQVDSRSLPVSMNQQIICSQSSYSYCDNGKLVSIKYVASGSSCNKEYSYSDSTTCKNIYLSGQCTSQGGQWTGSSCQTTSANIPSNELSQPPEAYTPVDPIGQPIQQVSPSFFQKYGFGLGLTLIALAVAIVGFIVLRKK